MPPAPPVRAMTPMSFFPPPPAPPPPQPPAPPPLPPPQAVQPVTKIIHIQHVFTPAEQTPSVSETPAQCPSECQQHCGPACARDGCCTDKKRKRNEMPKAPHQSVLLRLQKHKNVINDD